MLEEEELANTAVPVPVTTSVWEDVRFLLIAAILADFKNDGTTEFTQVGSTNDGRAYSIKITLDE